MIRRPTSKDIPAVVELAVESVSKDPLPVRIDREKIADACREALAPNNFALVSEMDGEVVGAFGAVCSPGFWFERQQCDVLLFYCRRSGDGVAMIREFAKWVKARPAIKLASFSLEPHMDPRVAKLLKRLGFGINFPQYVYVRGAGNV